MHLAVLELWIVLHAIFRALDDPRDDARGLASAHDVVAPPRARPAPDDRIELVLVSHARLIGRKLRVEREIRLAHEPAERLELRLRLARDEHPPVLSVAIFAGTAI